jgi:hypothetical protein
MDLFEPRLALSVNLGGDLIAHAFDFDHADVCHPLKLGGQATNLTLPPGMFDSPHHDLQSTGSPGLGPTSGGSSGAGGSGGNLLIDQASEVRRDFQLTGSGQTVVVIDSGIAWDHLALGNGFGPGYRVVGGWDFAENDADPYDDAPAGFHGTHVAGIIGGDGDGMTGVAPGADLIGLRVFTDLGRGSLDWIESALRWVSDNRGAFESPITTVNLSLGALLPDSLSDEIQGQLEDELQQLRDQGIVVVAAAGNQFDPAHPDRLNYPASSLNAWAVGSTDANGQLSSFSQRENSILVAPGERLVSTVPDHLLGRDGIVNDYYSATGTSMSAPQVAAASMLVREALWRIGQPGNPDQIHQILRDTADLRVDGQTGQSFYAINLSSAISSIFAPANDEPPAGEPPANVWESPSELGIVRMQQIAIDPSAGVRAIAATDGLFSVRPDGDGAMPVLRIVDDGGTELWYGAVPDSGQLDLPVNRGQAVTIHLDGNAAAAERLQLANVIGLRDGNLTLNSGPSDPDVAIDLRAGFQASVGDFQYQFRSDEVSTGTIDGDSGADHLRIQGSEATARLILNPYADGSFREGNVQLVLRGFEDVYFDSGGGADRAYLYDTRGNDVLTARPGHATLEGVGFRYEVTGVERSYVHATAGGQDLAFLYDSTANEELAVRPQFVSLRGNGFFNSAFGFERVYAYSTEGGFDRADLYDSAGNDRMTASSASALISGPGYYVQARGFDIVTGHSTAGGYDLATLYSDNADVDRWLRSNDQVTLRAADGSQRTAIGFDEVQTIDPAVRLQTLRQLAIQAERDALSDIFSALGADDEADDAADDMGPTA